MKYKTFASYWKDLNKPQREKLADKANTSVAYLMQVASGHRNAGAKLIENLMGADKLITFELMRSR
jgi:hypothetical protein